MTSQLAQKAVAAAMAGNWEEAEEANLEIIKVNPKDTPALNRLGRAYLEQGKKREAKKTFQKVLRLDQYNLIAQKNLELLKGLPAKKQNKVSILPDLFIEEPGKTKTISLTKTAEKKTISLLSIGEELSLQPRKHSIACYSQGGDYIGRLPDDLSQRLIKLLSGGNKYQAFAKSLNFPEVKIFIRELERAKRFADYPSFPAKAELSYQAFIPPELVHGERPEVKTSEDEEEPKVERS